MGIKTSSLFFLLTFPFSLFSTELEPWFGDIYQVEARTFLSAQNFEIPHRSACKEDAWAFFWNLSLGGFNCEYSSLEIESLTAQTSVRNFYWDCIRFTGRYFLWDDVAGDPFSLSTGLTLTLASHAALYDFNAFHHGQLEGEWHVAVGKEIPFYDEWEFRFWGIVGLGMAGRGYPWMHLELNAAGKWFMHEGKIFCRSLYGFGSKKLLNHCHFHGYSDIRHRSIDLGVRYDYQIDFNGSLGFEVFYRIYQQNFPGKGFGITLSYYYPLDF